MSTGEDRPDDPARGTDPTAPSAADPTAPSGAHPAAPSGAEILDRVLDADLAGRIAGRVAGAPGVPAAQARATVDRLRRAADEAVGHVAAITGVRAPDPRPGSVLVLDRGGWAVLNARSLRDLVAPVAAAEWGGAVGAVPAAWAAVGSAAGSVQVGTVLGLLAGRVLGQYDPGWGDPGTSGRLALVAPNVHVVGRRLGVDPEAFALWVCLHEETHRVQFEAHPWLSGHVAGAAREVVSALTGSRDDLERWRQVLRELPGVVAGRRPAGALVQVLSGRDGVPALERLTAVMALVEGHAEVVMDAVGPDVVPGVDEIRRRFSERRASRSVTDRLLRSVLGLDEKLRQYTEGAAFVRGVVAAVGHEGLELAYASPASLPEPHEIADPARWVARVATGRG